MTKSKYVPVGLTEELILNYAALPPELDGWRYYRIEMGGHAQSCFMECPIYLPRCVDAFIFDMLFDFWQSTGRKRRKILHDIIQELESTMSTKSNNVEII